MEASNIESEIAIHFLVGGFVSSPCWNFPSVFFRSKVIQEFHSFAMVENFFQFLGQMQY
jgi:hypothetical protein